MKKILLIFCTVFAVLAIGCGNMSADDDDLDHADSVVLDLTRPIHPPANFSGKRVLVAFFSRAGENFEVGVIDKGNTHIIAEQIAEITHADKIFEIQTITPYPINYQEMTKVAKEEQASSARPPLATHMEDMAAYDVIFLGYPIWYQDLPMPVYTFPYFAKGAQMRPGFGIQGKFVHNNPDQAKLEVANWLSSLGYSN